MHSYLEHNPLVSLNSLAVTSYTASRKSPLQRRKERKEKLLPFPAIEVGVWKVGKMDVSSAVAAAPAGTGSQSQTISSFWPNLPSGDQSPEWCRSWNSKSFASESVHFWDGTSYREMRNCYFLALIVFPCCCGSLWGSEEPLNSGKQLYFLWTLPLLLAEQKVELA